MQLDDRVWTVSNPRGQLEIQPHDTAAPEASIRTDPGTLNALLLDPVGLDGAIAAGSVQAEGNLTALRRLVEVAA